MLLLVFALALAGSLVAADMIPGSVYREYRVIMQGDAWRVTDPDARHEGAKKFLPNSQLTLEVDDLEGAARAELLLDRWGGHPGTIGQQVRFNGNAWLDVPLLSTTPTGSGPECYMTQNNPVMSVPLEHLREGRNVMEGTSGGQTCYDFGWGQWGQNAAILRIYYGSGKPHQKARITAPPAGATLGENPVIRVEAGDPAQVDRVDVLAFYDGYDEDGDGVFLDWHHGYFHNRRLDPDPAYPEISGHVGSAEAPPYAVRWDTRWVPDQPDGRLKLAARVRGKNGIWFVTEIVDGLSLRRKGERVRIYKPLEVGPRHWVRAGRSAVSKVSIPETDDVRRAVEAAVHIRTWNGFREYFTFNGWTGAINGENHVYALTTRLVPVNELRPGEQVITFHSETKHHGVEILWPGPALVVRYQEREAH